MTIDVNLVDGHTSRSVDIDGSGALKTYTGFGPLSKSGVPNRARYLTGVLGSTGIDSGTLNMNVDGSVTDQIFYVSSHPDYDIFIQSIILVIADSAVAHSNYGNVSALTNGVDLIFQESGEETFLLKEAKTGGQVLVQSGLNVPFGDGATVNELTNWTGTTDAQVIQWPVATFVPNGLRLGRGNKDRIEFQVHDDLTGLTEHTLRVFGYRLFPFS
jgi:hypothetical protein